MVVILQQSADNGNKFVTTLVDTPQDSSYTSGFSLNSQVSISERSAVYKQRIDSLFGKPPRVSPSSSRGEPFHIRIDGKSVSPTAGPMGSHRTSPSVTAPSTTTLREENEARILTTSDSDDYCRTNDKISMVTDSLNHRVKATSRKGNDKHGSNVSSVRITCDDSESSGSQLQSLTVASSSGEEGAGRSETGAEQIMWRNSNYGDNSPGNSAGRAKDKAFNTIRCSPGGMLKFSVEYLGSVPVKGNTAALQDLQAPLRTLYLNYLTKTNMMTGQLAITSDGLRFEAPKIRLVNPFTTIAVWAAVKFVGRGEPIPNECAFMPLISDPEGQDKSRLFGKMNPDLSSVYHDCVTESSKKFKNPPIFACVMREATFSLNCHAFACKCAEDAIVIAANLYQSLVDKIRTGKEGESGYGSLTRGSPATQSSSNPNRSSSSASSVVGTAKTNNAPIKSIISFKSALAQRESSSSTQQESRAVFSDSESIAPVRPPRKKKKPYEIPAGNLKRYNSDDSMLLNLPSRRRSFKTTYQGHYIKNKKRVQIHTPDEEDSSGDSLSDSVDQVLDRIVNPCGMSFNDLKPAYQDLLLKIALTLTQDQVYKKSKHAMKKQQQQQKLRKKPKSLSSSVEGSDDNAQFMNNFFKSISKISLSGKMAPVAKRPLSGKSEVTFRAKPKGLAQPQKGMMPSKAILKKTKEEEVPFMSFCSGCACDRCSDKCYCSLPSKHPLINGRAMPPTPTSSTTVASTPTQHPICSSGGGDMDIPGNKKICGYDTDSCAESEKCYCSLQRVKSNGLKIYNINLDTETSDTDTNSYDLEPFNISRLPTCNPTNGINKPDPNDRTVEILSYHPSRRLSHCFSPTFSQKSCSKDISPGSGSSEPERRCQIAGPSAGNKYVKKGRDLQNLDNSQLSKNKILLITGSNASGQVVYKDSPFNFRQGLDFGEGFSRRIDPNKIVTKSEAATPDVKSQDEEIPCCSSSLEKEFAPARVLSMKKTAEIAAMFTDMKLDPVHDFMLNGKEDTEALGNEMGSIDFETSLGYLP